VTGTLAQLSKRTEQGVKPKVGLVWLGTDPDDFDMLPRSM
jgi:hypothetical protein